MAATKSQKATKRAAGGRRTAASRDAGRIQLRRDTAPYRAAAQDQAIRLSDEINSALADARRTREEIEARIESKLHTRAPVASRASSRGGRGRKKA